MINSGEAYCKLQAIDESQQTGSEELTWFMDIVSYHIHCCLTVLITKELEQVLFYTFNTSPVFTDIINVVFI